MDSGHDKTNGVDYKIMDVVPDYSPDIVGDIHNMPLPTIPLAPLFVWRFEHDEDAESGKKHRVLKPGGYCLFRRRFFIITIGRILQ